MLDERGCGVRSLMGCHPSMDEGSPAARSNTPCGLHSAGNRETEDERGAEEHSAAGEFRSMPDASGRAARRTTPSSTAGTAAAGPPISRIEWIRNDHSRRELAMLLDDGMPVVEARTMSQTPTTDVLARYRTQVVVLDLTSPYVAVGTLVDEDHHYLVLDDADMHDLRDSATTRELYVLDLHRHGLSSNRRRVLVSRTDIVGISLLEDVV